MNNFAEGALKICNKYRNGKMVKTFYKWILFHENSKALKTSIEYLICNNGNLNTFLIPSILLFRYIWFVFAYRKPEMEKFSFTGKSPTNGVL